MGVHVCFPRGYMYMVGASKFILLKRTGGQVKGKGKNPEL